jgi:hypothetical protein
MSHASEVLSEELSSSGCNIERCLSGIDRAYVCTRADGRAQQRIVGNISR